MIGQTIAHYTITSKIGAGGMGEVFRATDSKLNRDVALKILPETWTADAQRMGRFQREAQLLASLNHPNIAAIYGLEESGNVRALVLEFVDGEDLSELLQSRQPGLDESLEIAVQIAEALESAHEKNIIHRDLKPANVKITTEGKVKVLDFGLAKALTGDTAADPSEVSLSMSPTMTAAATGAGLILGTAAYMSPEQARGKSVDRRADIWAFGVLLYELLTRKQLFAGETVSDTLASVIKDEPDWSLIPADTPPLVVDLMRRCMEKDPRRRLQSIGEARIALDDLMRGNVDGSSTRSVLSSSMHAALPAEEPEAIESAGGRRWIATAVLLLVVALGAAWVGRSFLAPETEPRLRKFQMSPPGLVVAYPTQPVMSPDGRRLAYFANGALHVRDLHTLEAITVPGTLSATAPFWSPDSEWLAWGQPGRIYKMPAAGGSPIAICDLPFSILDAGCWSEDGQLFMAPNAGPLYQVSARGGDPRIVFEPEDGESDYHTPTALPGGRGILYTVHDTDGRETVELFANGERRILFKVPGARIEYVTWTPTEGSRGHLVYHRRESNDGIWAVPFDLDALELAGEPFILDPDGAFPSVGNDGSLFYAVGSGGGERQLAFVDREGEVVRKVGQPQAGMIWPRLSPDGRHALVSSAEADNRNIWMHDLDRGTRTRITFGTTVDWQATWMNDGQDIIFTNGSAQTNRTWIRPANGTHEPELLLDGYHVDGPTSDGLVAFNRFVAGTGSDIYVQDLGSDAEAHPIVAAQAAEVGPRVSPDGRYMVYMSNETTGNEVYLTSFPSGDGKWQVSANGGAWPCWSRDGKEIIYRQASGAVARMMSVSFSADPEVQLGSPEELFSSASSPQIHYGMGFSAYSPSNDRDELLMLLETGESAARRSYLVYSENWYESYRRGSR